MCDLSRACYRTFLIALALVFFTACARHCGYILPKHSEAPFTHSGVLVAPARWWQALDAPDLDAHVETALQKNYSLVAAWERLLAARAIARREASALSPDLSLLASSSAVQEENGSFSGDHALGIAASYELDLWGRVRASVMAEDLRSLATEEAYRTAALSLSAEIAITWASLIEAHHYGL